MPDEDQDKLWELLGKAKVIEPNPRFTDNVMRQIERLERPRPSVLRFPRWLLALGGSAAAAVIAVGILLYEAPLKPDLAAPAALTASTPTPSPSDADVDAFPALPPAIEANFSDSPTFALTNSFPFQNSSLPLVATNTSPADAKFHELDVIPTGFELMNGPSGGNAAP